MNALEYVTLSCPYFVASNELAVERSLEAQSYAEDCQSCCRPMQVAVQCAAEELTITLSRDDD